MSQFFKIVSSNKRLYCTYALKTTTSIMIDPSEQQPASPSSDGAPQAFPNPSPTPTSTYPRNFSFYFDYRTFLVEETLFRFPINLLAQESPVFRDMMEIPTFSTQEGLTDDDPIRLDGVLHDDFVQLLTILAPPQRFKQPVPSLSFSEWTSVLNLADMWCMDRIREHAIKTMNKTEGVDPVEKLVVARTYRVDAWLSPSLDAIIRRSQDWTEHDVERLGLSTVLKLVALRDRLQPVQGRYGLSWEIASARQEVPSSVNFQSVIKAELSEFKCT
ncbi:hypothetical protein FB446DRAFT_793371 [Lentinula raphanica]|nr:hypothetical protein FB446DRAFT_793371 [Lentinula raphanica]